MGSPSDGSSQQNKSKTDVSHSYYLYCLIPAPQGENGIPELNGVDSTEVELIQSDGIGCIVHPCDGPYEVSTVDILQKEILNHQRVVDTIGETFGTPLPVRFNTVLAGGKRRIRAWITENQDDIQDGLSSLVNHWEYRVQVRFNRSGYQQTLIDSDEKLQEIDAQIAAASEGTAFMLEKKREKRLSSLTDERESEIVSHVRSILQSNSREFQLVEETAALDSISSESSDEKQDVAKFSALVHKTNEGSLGSALDEVAEVQGVSIRFSGPWPPYSFAPDIGE